MRFENQHRSLYHSVKQPPDEVKHLPGLTRAYVSCLRRVLGRALPDADACSVEGVSGPQLMIAFKHTRARA